MFLLFLILIQKYIDLQFKLFICVASCWKLDLQILMVTIFDIFSWSSLNSSFDHKKASVECFLKSSLIFRSINSRQVAGKNSSCGRQVTMEAIHTSQVTAPFMRLSSLYPIFSMNNVSRWNL